ncbi:hypothetical protein [Aquisalibacillus elongatus]|uniref:Uncharacterized protein n=1 Tax=Aquisalibacillus elongatus TaxID=485577 RepID=A0A3N5C714_9BACI|nr:hypothetical protein [Aquisalibacillus elongatus]RPF52231.1 hypothetical protein EDC24_2224 [Aquisalibacillus elongatus]
MLARILTYLLIGGLLIAAVAVTAPQYLYYLFIAFGVVFVIGTGYLAFVYAKRVITLIKDLKEG